MKKVAKIGVRKINSFLKKLPTVKYKVTGNFGTSDVGEVVDAHLVSDEGCKALLYVSTNFRNSECGVFILCKREYDRSKKTIGVEKDFVYVDLGKETWTNLETGD